MLNEKARAVYDYIKTRTDNGIPPSVREICAALELKSTATAHRYINLLVTEGYLEKQDNQNRSLCLKRHKTVNVPLLGKIPAALPITALENVTAYIGYTTERQFSTPLFAYRVPPELSDVDGIVCGDILILEQSEQAMPNALLFVWDGMADSLPLLTREIDAVHVLGYVVGLLREFS